MGDSRLSDVELNKSVWDIAAFIGLPELGFGVSAVLLISTLLNMLVQVCLCYLLLTSDFMDTARFVDAQEPMERWRLRDAHDARHLSRDGVSLSSSVCRQDPSLHIASHQLDLLKEINTYLTLNAESLKLQGFPSGPLLCTVSLFYFVVSVMQELRTNVILFFALVSVPREEQTRLERNDEGVKLCSISIWRFTIGLCIFIMRACVAVILLLTGVLWLCFTSSMTDLVLNAAALCFIMDLDEMLFKAMAPVVAQRFVQCLQPLQYKRSRWHLEGIIPTFVTFAIILAVAASFITQNVHVMLELKKIMCAGHTDFVTSRTPSDFIVSRQTETSVAMKYNLEVKAVEELRDHTEPFRVGFRARFSDWSTSVNFVIRKDQSLEGLRADSCNDFDGTDFEMKAFANTARQTEILHEAFSYMVEAALEQMSLGSGGVSSERPQFSCVDFNPNKGTTEFVGACDNKSYILLRVLCPVSCGCDDPVSGQTFVTPLDGCSQACGERSRSSMAALPCEDLDVISTSITSDGKSNVASAWTRLWLPFKKRATFYVHHEFNSRKVREHVMGYIEVSIAMKLSQGCDGFMRDDEAFGFCGDGAIPGLDMPNVAAFCPAYCCRHHNQPTVCRHMQSCDSSNVCVKVNAGDVVPMNGTFSMMNVDVSQGDVAPLAGMYCAKGRGGKDGRDYEDDNGLGKDKDKDDDKDDGKDDDKDDDKYDDKDDDKDDEDGGDGKDGKGTEDSGEDCGGGKDNAGDKGCGN